MAEPAAKPKHPRLLMRVREAADRLAVSGTEAYRLLRRGALPWVHIGRSRSIVVADLEAFEKNGPEHIWQAAAPILVRQEPMDAAQREAADRAAAEALGATS